MILDMDDSARNALAVSAARYAVGRRTYVTGCISDILTGNAGRFASDTNMELRRIVDVPATMLDPIDLPCWRRALRALETAVLDTTAGLDGSDTDLRVFMSCAFRHDMSEPDAAAMWLALLDLELKPLDASWRSISARDLYENGHAPVGAPEPPIQHLQPFERVIGPWNAVYAKLLSGTHETGRP